MAIYRRFHEPIETLSRINQARIAANSGARPQTIEAIRWHAGDDTRGLAQKWLDILEDGDYIIVDYPEHPYVWKKEDFEATTEHIND